MSRPPAFYSPQPWQSDVLPMATSMGSLPTCSTTPGRQALPVPKTPDQPHSCHVCSLCGVLVRCGQEQKKDPGDLPQQSRNNTAPGPDASLLWDGHDVSTSLLGWALNYSHRGQLQIISFSDGIYLNLYITCNFSNSFLSLFYFFLNSIFGIGQLILKK